MDFKYHKLSKQNKFEEEFNLRRWKRDQQIFIRDFIQSGKLKEMERNSEMVRQSLEKIKSYVQI